MYIGLSKNSIIITLILIIIFSISMHINIISYSKNITDTTGSLNRTSSGPIKINIPLTLNKTFTSASIFSNNNSILLMLVSPFSKENGTVIISIPINTETDSKPETIGFNISGYKIIQINKNEYLIIDYNNVYILNSNKYKEGPKPINEDQQQYFYTYDIYPNKTVIVGIKTSKDLLYISQYIFYNDNTKIYKLFYINSNDIENKCDINNIEFDKNNIGVITSNGDKMILTFILSNGSVIFLNLDNDNIVNCVIHDFGSQSEAIAAVGRIKHFNNDNINIYNMNDALFPYIVGYDGNDELFIYKYNSNSIYILDNNKIIYDHVYSINIMTNNFIYYMIISSINNNIIKLNIINMRNMEINTIEIPYNGEYNNDSIIVVEGKIKEKKHVFISVGNLVYAIPLDKHHNIIELLSLPNNIIYIDYNDNIVSDIILLVTKENNMNKIKLYYMNDPIYSVYLELIYNEKSFHVLVGNEVKLTVKLHRVIPLDTILEGSLLIQYYNYNNNTWINLTSIKDIESNEVMVKVNISTRGIVLLRAVYYDSNTFAVSNIIKVYSYEYINSIINVINIINNTITINISLYNIITNNYLTNTTIKINIYNIYTKYVISSVINISNGTGLFNASLLPGEYKVNITPLDPYIKIVSSNDVDITIHEIQKEKSSKTIIFDIPDNIIVSYTKHIKIPIIIYKNNNITVNIKYLDGNEPLDIEYDIRPISTGLYLIEFNAPNVGTYLVEVTMYYNNSNTTRYILVQVANLTNYLATINQLYNEINNINNKLNSIIEKISKVQNTVSNVNKTYIKLYNNLTNIITELIENVTIYENYLAYINKSITDINRYVYINNKNINNIPNIIDDRINRIDNNLTRLNNAINVLSNKLENINPSKLFIPVIILLIGVLAILVLIYNKIRYRIEVVEA